MADEKRVAQTIEAQLLRLTAGLADAHKQIEWMRKVGGFTDAKNHSMRATRLEGRTEVLETKTEALLDVSAHLVELLQDHLQDRHDADLSRDNAIDVVYFRRIRKRLHQMAEKLGLIANRTDVRNVRQDENRLRPQAAH